MEINLSVITKRIKSNIFLSSILLIVISFGLIGGCGSGGGSNDQIQQVIDSFFTDVTSQAGFNYTHGFAPTAGNPEGGPVSERQLISGGVAAGDYDKDGWVDLYVVGGTLGPNLLFRNLGNGSFQEVGQSAGVDLSGGFNSGPIFVDFSGDGYLDLFVGALSPTEVSFFLNNSNGTFSDISNQALLSQVSGANTFSATFGDYDKDNDLDMIMSHWGSGFLGPMQSSEHLWRNNGDNTFTDVSTAAGISETYQLSNDFTFSPNFADINNDGYPDILMANDFITSQVFINQKDGTFLNTTDRDVIIDANGMGAAIGDYDNDGDLDWFVSSIYDPNGTAEANWDVFGNRLYRNKGDGTFEDVTVAAGVDHGFWGWGSCFADFDNDGNLDIFHVNGFGFDEDDLAAEFFEDPSRLFMSNGNGTFTEKAVELGIDDTGQGRGVVCFDYDKDGDIDIFIANNNQSPKLYQNNEGNTKNFLNIQLKGLPPNTEGIGARITITVDGNNQIRELRAGNNFVSQNPAYAHFGLNNAQNVSEVHVKWLDGEETSLTNISANQFLTINHPNL